MTTKSAVRIVFLISTSVTRPLPSNWEQNTAVVICDASSLMARERLMSPALGPLADGLTYDIQCRPPPRLGASPHNACETCEPLGSATNMFCVSERRWTVSPLEVGARVGALWRRVYPGEQWRIRIASYGELNTPVLILTWVRYQSSSETFVSARWFRGSDYGIYKIYLS